MIQQASLRIALTSRWPKSLAWTRWAALVAVVSLTAFAPSDAAGATSQDPKAKSVVGDELRSAPFTHAKHVPEAWVRGEPERYRDCRGCHDYSGQVARDPQAVCVRCHFTDAINSYSFDLTKSVPGFERDLGACRTPGGLFSHTVHLNLECRTCHPAQSGSIEAPTLLPTISGAALCTSCHGESPTRDINALPFMQNIAEAQRTASSKMLSGNLVATLNKSASMGPNQGAVIHVGPFRHADHLAPERLADAFSLQALAATRAALAKPGERLADNPDCATCHGPMFDAGDALAGPDRGPLGATFQQAATTCGTCHIADAARTPLVFAVAPTQHPSSAAGTFSHATHLAATSTPPATGALASVAGHAGIHQQGCAVCHAYDQVNGQTFAVRADRSQFAGCQSCHEVAPWAPPVHAGWWLPRDHGQWQACTSCHATGESDFKAARPMSEVRRRSPGTFRIETQAHPHITRQPGELVANDAIAQDCAQCHRRPVALLPSRVKDAVFQHSTHLPMQPKAADCARCHGSRLEAATRSAEIGVVAVGASGTRVDLTANTGSEAAAKYLVGLVYDPSACTECHLGSAPTPMRPFEGLAAEPARQVVEFSHQGHLGKTGRDGAAIGCLDCHAFDRTGVADAAASVTTRPTALNCTMCHDHQDRAATSSGVSDAELRGCAQCHGAVPPLSSPGSSVAVAVTGASIVDLVGSVRQFHPPGQDCKACHITMADSVLRVTSNSRVVATRSFYAPPNDPRVRTAVHRGNTSKFPEDRTDCFLCHWTDAYMDAPGERGGTTSPESDAARRLRGDDMRNYPGGK